MSEYFEMAEAITRSAGASALQEVNNNLKYRLERAEAENRELRSIVEKLKNDLQNALQYD